jgi:hypothetical protein
VKFQSKGAKKLLSVVSRGAEKDGDALAMFAPRDRARERESERARLSSIYNSDDHWPRTKVNRL